MQHVPSRARRGRRRFHWSLLLTAMAGIALSLLAQPPSAEAAATLTVNPNPVLVAPGQTGRATVQWNTDLPGGSIVTMSRDGGAEYIFATLGRRYGSAEFSDVRLDSRYVVRLYPTGDRTRLLASVTVTTVQERRSGPQTSPMPDPEQACVSRCISNVAVTPHGTYATMRVEASAAVTFQVDVGFGLRPNQRLDRSVYRVYGPRARDWSGDLLNLEPGTEYQYVISAVDDAGNLRRETGSFRTLRRQIQVDFQRIRVIDDGDDGLSGNGEAVFWLLANDEPSVERDFRGATIPAVCSGCTISSLDGGPLVRITVEDALTRLRLRAYGGEEDPPSCCTFEPPAIVIVEGIAITTEDWASGSYTTDITNRGQDEEFARTFSISALPQEGSLRFTVDGVFYVRYVP